MEQFRKFQNYLFLKKIIWNALNCRIGLVWVQGSSHVGIDDLIPTYLNPRLANPTLKVTGRHKLECLKPTISCYYVLKMLFA